MLTNLDQNYYLRKCFLERKEVPTQSMVRKKMGEPLAKVYFGYMNYKTKVYAGLEPRLHGGGPDQLAYPSDILDSKYALKPMKKENLQMFGYNGIAFYADKYLTEHEKSVKLMTEVMMKESDLKWKKEVMAARYNQFCETSEIESKSTTKKLRGGMKQFEMLYESSLNELESLLQRSAIKSILDLKNQVTTFMELRYRHLLEKQTDMLRMRYSKRFIEKREEMKNKFNDNFNKERKTTLNTITEVHNDKQDAMDAMRQRAECQNLACKMYIAYLEKGKCRKKIQEMEKSHSKFMEKIKASSHAEDARLQELKEKLRRNTELSHLWQQKVGHILTYFKTFTAYCLKSMPEQTEFFRNLSELFISHMNETLQNNENSDYFLKEDHDECSVCADDIFCEDNNIILPKPIKPFVIYGDFKPKIFDTSLCRRFSKSDLPVVMINKRCIYSSCDNYNVFIDKLQEWFEGEVNEKVSKVASNVEATLTLEMDIINTIQGEILYFNSIPDCLCDPCELLPKDYPQSSTINKMKTSPCMCAQKVRKTLKEHMPPYMLNYKTYPWQIQPHYEGCTSSELKVLISKKISKLSSQISIETPMYREVGTQYEDIEIENIICKMPCLPEVSESFISDTERDSKGYKYKKSDWRFKLVGSSSSMVDFDSSSYAMNRVRSLKNFLIHHPSVAQVYPERNNIITRI